MMSLRC